MRNIYRLFPILLFTFSTFACNTNKDIEDNTKEKSEGEFVFDSTKIQLNIPAIDSMYVIYTDNDAKVAINKEDWGKFANSFASAKYDTEWNDKDIMVKMVAPDYTFIIQYSGKDSDASDWLSLWKENNRMKYKGKWFTIAENEIKSAYQILERYKFSGK